VDGAGRAARYDGSAWSTPATIDPGQKLSAISCASPTFCVAVDGAGHALTYNGSVWAAPLTVDPGGALTSISCPTTSYCLAVDDLGNAVTWSGSAWSRPTSITTPGGSWHLGPVSCPTAGFCAVAYAYPDGEECLEPGPSGFSDDGSPGADGMLVSDGGQWGQPQLLTQTQCQYHEGVELPFVTSVSCASASFCLALDSSTEEWNAAARAGHRPRHRGCAREPDAPSYAHPLRAIMAHPRSRRPDRLARRVQSVRRSVGHRHGQRRPALTR
jgi:hypothetical protein